MSSNPGYPTNQTYQNDQQQQYQQAPQNSYLITHDGPLRTDDPNLMNAQVNKMINNTNNLNNNHQYIQQQQQQPHDCDPTRQHSLATTTSPVAGQHQNVFQISDTQQQPNQYIIGQSQYQPGKLYTDMDQQATGQRVKFNASPCYDPTAEAQNQLGNRNLQDNLLRQPHTSNNIITDNGNFIVSNNQLPRLDNQMNNNQQQQHHQHQPQQQNLIFQQPSNQPVDTQPRVEIVEQPARCALRFRYKCEGRSAGSLPGANSTVDSKTFPSIRISNYRGRAVVVISCVTSNEPYRAHPHNIVGREGCKKGICTIVIKQNEPNSLRSFPSLGIQCVKRRDIEESLNQRESIKVDPFAQGFGHKDNPNNIDLNVIRLCFQVFIEGQTPGKCDFPLMPVVSSQIHDKKAMSDLVITKLSHCSAPATGGREVILLCDRINKDDIKIRFYEERQGRIHWETYYEPGPADIHKQVAICFKTPKYFNENIQQPVMVRIQLKRMSDNQVSESRPFQFLPCESDEDIIHRKRQKIDWVNPDRYALN